MAHHKRKRPKNRRAGCLFCKPHKANGSTQPHHSRRIAARLAEPVPKPHELNAAT